MCLNIVTCLIKNKCLPFHRIRNNNRELYLNPHAVPSAVAYNTNC